MTVFGWDASDYDWDRGPMDLAAAAKAGIVFFTHKSLEVAPEGTYVHSHFPEAMARARAAGIPLYGTYVVPRTGVSVAAQVQALKDYLNGHLSGWATDPKFFIQVDLEKWPYDAVPASVGVDMVRQIKAKLGRKVLLYASAGQYGDGISAEMLKWNANYPPEHAPTRDFRDIYRAVGGDGGAGWKAYSGRTPYIWQYASDATIGRQPSCDANAFRGTLQGLVRLIGDPITPTVVAPPAVVKTKDYQYPYQVILDILKFLPKPYVVTDTTRTLNGPIANGVWDFHVGKAAVDISGSDADMRDNAAFLVRYSKYLTELIHTTPYSTDSGFYVKNAAVVGESYYGPATNAAHLNHVHVAIKDMTVALALLALLQKQHLPVKAETMKDMLIVSDGTVKGTPVFIGDGVTYRWVRTHPALVSLLYWHKKLGGSGQVIPFQKGTVPDVLGVLVGPVPPGYTP